jgi:hypothetical protein
MYLRLADAHPTLLPLGWVVVEDHAAFAEVENVDGDDHVAAPHQLDAVRPL